MAARTTYAQVAAIIDLDAGLIPDEAALTPFIDVANDLVTEACVTGGPTPAYSDVRLELIERWLTAHIYTIRDPRASSESAGAVSVSYQSSVGLGFDTSHYGQMAMRLDTNGGLATLNTNMKTKKSRIGAIWLGTDYADIPTD